jgi:hypothetical protein
MDQVVGLKNEPNFSPADFRKLIVVHLRDVLVAEMIRAGGWPIEASEKIEQGGFAGA